MFVRFIFVLLVSNVLVGCSLLTPSAIEEPIQPPRERLSFSKTLRVIGDSLSAGYQLALEDAYPAQVQKILLAQGYTLRVVNAGESGDTSAGVLDRLDRVTAEAQSGDIALVVIGGNDGLQGLPIAQLKENIRKTLHILQSRGIITILGGMQIPTNLGESYRTEFSSLYPTIAQETNSILIPFILSGVAGIPELNLADGIHPNTTGQAIIAQTVFQTLIEQNLMSL